MKALQLTAHGAPGQFQVRDVPDPVPGSDEVVVRVRHQSTVSNQITLLFSVSDTGVGMTEEQMEKLFHAFSQADIQYAQTLRFLTVDTILEGMAGTLLGIIKKELLSDFRGKLGALIAKPAFKRVKKLMDYTEVGGAPLLGVKGAVVKAHGSSNGHAIACAIRQAAVMARTGVAQTIEETLKTMPQADE